MAIFIVAKPAAADPYSYTTIIDPLAVPPDGTAALGINDSGAITGTYVDSSGNVNSFLDVGGSFTTIDDPLATTGGTLVIGGTDANGINDADAVVGFYYVSTASNVAAIYGFLYAGGSFTTIQDPSGVSGSSQAFGINNVGMIVGNDLGSDGLPHGFLDVGGSFTPINDPLGTLGTDVFAINDAGAIVGIYDDNTGSHSFLDVGGIFTTIEDPAATAAGVPTLAAGINDAGAIVGEYFDNSGASHGFVDIGGVFTPIDDPLAAAEGTVPNSINNSGTIAGDYVTSTEIDGFVATPQPSTSVPEPTSLVVLATSLAGLCVFRRRKVRRGRISIRNIS